MPSPDFTLIGFATAVLLPRDWISRRIPNHLLVLLAICLLASVCGGGGVPGRAEVRVSEDHLATWCFANLICLILWQSGILAGGDIKFLLLAGAFFPGLTITATVIGLLLASAVVVFVSVVQPGARGWRRGSRMDSHAAPHHAPWMPFFVTGCWLGQFMD